MPSNLFIKIDQALTQLSRYLITGVPTQECMYLSTSMIPRKNNGNYH